MRKKVDKEKCFSVITKNSNWEILTKNLVTFKRYNGFNNEKLNFWVSLKNSIFRGRRIHPKKPM